MGRGRFLQLLSMPLSPCCPYHPAEVTCRLGQSAPCHAAFAPEQGARPPDSFLSRPPVGSLTLRPGDSLTIPRMALSIGFIHFVSSTNAIQATGLLTLTPVGLMSPTEHASLRWTTLPRKNPILQQSDRFRQDFRSEMLEPNVTHIDLAGGVQTLWADRSSRAG